MAQLTKNMMKLNQEKDKDKDKDKAYYKIYESIQPRKWVERLLRVIYLGLGCYI